MGVLELEQVQAITDIDVVVKLATETAIEIYEQRIEKDHAKKREQARKNTKKLLAGYNELKEHCENAIADIESSVPTDLQLLLTELFNRRGVLRVESILASKRRTELILEHVDNMLDVYRKQCNYRNQPYFKSLVYFYIDKLDVDAVADKLNVEKRTVYRYLEQAENDMALLIWGIQAV
jgi:hypothetical protein